MGISRTDDEIAEVERSLYQRYASQLTTLIRDAQPALSATAARATDVIVLHNGLWLNWARHHDRSDLERGLGRCDSIALEVGAAGGVAAGERRRP